MNNLDLTPIQIIKLFFKEYRENPLSLDIYVKKIKEFINIYLKINEQELENEDLKKIAFEIYHNIKLQIGSLINIGNNFKALKLLQLFEMDINLMSYKCYIKKLDELEYILMLSYMLYINNDDYESYMKCNISISEYFTSKKAIIDRIYKEEDQIKKSHSDKALYYNYLVSFSKFAQIICLKTGLKDDISKKYWNEKFFNEKLYFMCENVSPLYQMITQKKWVWEGDIIHTIIVDDHYTNKYQKYKSKINLYFNAIKLLSLRFISGYGEKPTRLLFTSVILSCSIALIYAFLDNNIEKYLSYCYSSILIFFSFGLIDDNLIKQNAINRIIIILEIILGIIFTNGYIVTLTRKLFR